MPIRMPGESLRVGPAPVDAAKELAAPPAQPIVRVFFRVISPLPGITLCMPELAEVETQTGPDGPDLVGHVVQLLPTHHGRGLHDVVVARSNGNFRFYDIAMPRLRVLLECLGACGREGAGEIAEFRPESACVFRHGRR